MNSEIRNCQNCKADFTIESDDFSFYEKIKVPPPTFCPECRFVRRMIWRNERSLYKINCDMCKKSIISMYDDKFSFPVYCPECYRSDKWEAGSFLRDYDFSKPFFKQFRSLFNTVVRQSVVHNGTCINSEYANYILNSKNIYLSYSVIFDSENIYFSTNIDKSFNVLDSLNLSECDLIYESMGLNKTYNTLYSYWSSNCVDCNFVLFCKNCQNCFGCVNLVNKSYCIFNIEYSKEQYEEKMKEFDLGSYSFVKSFKKDFWKFSLSFSRKYAQLVSCIDSSGDELKNSKNIKNSFNCYGLESVRFGYRSAYNKDSYDICNAGIGELFYEHGGGGSDNSLNIKFIITGKEGNSFLEYCDACQNSSNLFGCIGLKSKQYCILNKQYTKEEYFEMVEKIKKQMDDMPYVDSKNRVYKYGEFFPYELCPFGYNEAVINDHFPLSKEEIIKRGYMYKEKNDNKYTITLKAKDIPDNIKDTDDSILNEVIECEVSKRAFKITQFELEFYRRMNIPIPHLHPDERYKERLLLRNPMKLWHRTCMKEGCTNEFETSYSPDRPEIIYCEECYKREIY
jgi:hypothetical protein